MSKREVDAAQYELFEKFLKFQAENEAAAKKPRSERDGAGGVKIEELMVSYTEAAEAWRLDVEAAAKASEEAGANLIRRRKGLDNVKKQIGELANNYPDLTVCAATKGKKSGFLISFT